MLHTIQTAHSPLIRAPGRHPQHTRSLILTVQYFIVSRVRHYILVVWGPVKVSDIAGMSLGNSRQITYQKAGRVCIIKSSVISQYRFLSSYSPGIPNVQSSITTCRTEQGSQQLFSPISLYPVGSQRGRYAKMPLIHEEFKRNSS